MVNGVTELMMMKADVLSDFDEIEVCTHYEYQGKKIDYLPYNIEPNYVKPITTKLKGWGTDLTGIDDKKKIPSQLKDYISFIEKAVECPVTIVSVGPDRKQTIRMN
jgi:adenylosuccinate synthase